MTKIIDIFIIVKNTSISFKMIEKVSLNFQVKQRMNERFTIEVFYYTKFKSKFSLAFGFVNLNFRNILFNCEDIIVVIFKPKIYYCFKCFYSIKLQKIPWKPSQLRKVHVIVILCIKGDCHNVLVQIVWYSIDWFNNSIWRWQHELLSFFRNVFSYWSVENVERLTNNKQWETLNVFNSFHSYQIWTFMN